MKKRIRIPIFLLVIIGVLCIWTCSAKSGERYTPDYVKEDLTPCLTKEELTEEDYQFLYRQTGLGRDGVEKLWKEGDWEELLYLQKRFFAEVEVECENSWFLYNESIIGYGEDWGAEEGNFMPTVEDGDILITFNSHFLGWRNGHAALVIDADEGLTLEARNMGSESAVMYLSNWKNRPSFLLLRLKDASEETRAEIARYAKDNLVGIPYQLTAVISGQSEEERDKNEVNMNEEDVTKVPAGTQCAHLVWYAYHVYGYDLQVGNGRIFTPWQLSQSPLLEVVQVYGFQI